MKNLSISKKLIVTFFIVIILFLVVVALTILNMNTVSNDLGTFHDHSFIASTEAQNIQRNLTEMEKYVLEAITATNDQQKSMYLEELSQAVTGNSASREALAQALLGSQDKLEKLNNIIAQQGGPLRAEILSLLEANKNDEALEVFINEYVPVANSARAVAEEIRADVSEQADGFYIESKIAAQNGLIAALAISSAALLITVVLCVYIVRSITKPILEIENTTKELAAGNLSASIAYQSRDELGSLADNTRALIDSLRTYIGNISDVLGTMAEGDMTVDVTIDYLGDFAPIKASLQRILAALNSSLTQISQSSEQVASGSNQVASGAQALSQGSTEQASSVEELSATIGEISLQIKQNAENAQEANKMVNATTKEIENGNRQMLQLVTAMDDISKTSNQIGKIIKTIDDIAFQTNILALNAAVEAARAGNAGKGFAVVAEEVRSLAGKSAEAAKDTTSLIESAIQAIQNGTHMVSATEKSLNLIVEKADGVSRLVNEIAEASNAQATAILQTTQGIEQISNVVQNNSATAEESAAASEELSGQALVLQQLITRFRLEGQGQLSPTTSPVVAARRSNAAPDFTVAFDKY